MRVFWYTNISLYLCLVFYEFIYEFIYEFNNVVDLSSVKFVFCNLGTTMYMCDLVGCLVFV